MGMGNWSHGLGPIASPSGVTEGRWSRICFPHTVNGTPRARGFERQTLQGAVGGSALNRQERAVFRWEGFSRGHGGGSGAVDPLGELEREALYRLASGGRSGARR